MNVLGASIETALRDLIRESVRDGLLDAFERVRADLVLNREPPAPMQSDWMAVSAVAAKVGVTAETVRSWISTRKLSASRPSGKPHGRLRISTAELNLFLGSARDGSGVMKRERPDPRNVAAKILSSSNSK